MIEVLRAGVLTTVQDLGRSGHRQFGVSVGGALDSLALAVANRLVGNPVDAAGLEITVGRVAFRFLVGTRIALTGAECDARVNGIALPSGWSLLVAAGQILTLGTARQGVRAYLAVSGGIDVPVTMGSRATDLAAGFGGFHGRALANGDMLALQSQTSERSDAPVNAHSAPPARSIGAGAFGVMSFEWSELSAHAHRGRYGSDIEGQGGMPAATPVGKPRQGVIALRILRGPEYNNFSALACAMLLQQNWVVTPNSNRMGYRLDGTPLARERATDMLSHTVLPGTIQVPPSGQPIVLMSDAQTAGGYPKIGSVIMADLWRLAQTPLGSRVRFVECSVDEARHALLQIRVYLKQVSLAIGMRDEIRPRRGSA